MQNLARFRTTSKFDGDRLRNERKKSKSDKYIFHCDFFCVWWKKSGELRSSNLGDLKIELYFPKTLFSKDHILALKKCCDSKFLHALKNDQVLLAHTQPETGVFLTSFFQKNFADCVMVKFELLNCDLCCFISTTTMSPLHCSLYKLNSFFYINCKSSLRETEARRQTAAAFLFCAIDSLELIKLRRRNILRQNKT